MNEIQGTSVGILGFGREGRSALAYLRQRHPKITIGILDKTNFDPSLVPAPSSEIKLHCGDDYLDALESYDTIIRSPGIPLSLAKLQLAASSGVHLTSTTNIFFSEAPGTIVAVTGTKGKSTTAALCAEILASEKSAVRLVGNIGNPVLDYLDDATDETVFVVECSSYQLEDFRYAPQIAVLLNVVEEHLDYHGSFANYLSAKSNLVRAQNSEQQIVYNPRWEHSSKMASESAAQSICFGDCEAANCIAYIEGQSVFLQQNNEALCSVDQLPLRGPGNIENVLAAITVANQLGISADSIRERLKQFSGLPHRLEYIGSYSGIDFYDDSLSTVPQATINALLGLGKRVSTLIAGGNDRGLNYTSLGKMLAESSVRNLILFPTTGEQIWQACRQHNAALTPHHVHTMSEAVEACYKHTAPGEICLLSPASSSLNQFRDYRDRGEQFSKLVKEKCPL